MSNKIRITWLDTCKGIGILLVIIGHTPIDPALRGIIYGFHMPLFFFISGFFFSIKDGGIREFITSRVKYLLVPYFIFSIITFGIVVYIFKQPFTLGNLISETIISQRNNISFNQPMWFLTSLFTIEIIFYVFYRLFKNKYVITLIVIIIAFFATFKLSALSGGNILPWSIDQSLYYLLFFALGSLIKRLGIFKGNLMKSPLFIILAAIYILILISPESYHKLWGWLNLPAALSIYFSQAILALLGIAFVIYLSQFLANLKFLNYLGRNSLILMALHVPLGFNLYNKWIKGKLGLTIENLNIFGLAVTISTVFFLLPVAFFINKYLPFIMGRSQKTTEK